MEKKKRCQIDELTFAFLDSKLPPVDQDDRRRDRLDYFAKRLNFSLKHIQNIVLRKRNLSTESAEKLAALYGLTHLQMLLEGKKILDLGKPETSARVFSTPPKLTVTISDKLRSYHEAHPISRERYHAVRILKGRVAAGSPLDVEESETDGWALIFAEKSWMPNAPENYSCVHVSGRSMWPILSDGDIVAIDHAQRDPRELDGKMVAFRVDGGVTIKWLKYDASRKVLVGIPENTEELDHIVTLEGPEIDAGIVGKVAWWWAKR